MSSMRPQISVVIPTFNRARFVTEAVHSVLGQRGVDLEVLVVDDGSTDDTATIVAGFGAPVRYLWQPRAGASAARNKGILAATAQWVAFLDSDDLWLPGKLAHQRAQLEAAPEAVAHFTNVCVAERFAHATDLFSLREMHHFFAADQQLICERPLTLNARYNLARNQSALVRRDALMACGLFDERYRRFQDAELWNRLALEGAWVISPHVFVREIRRREGIRAIGDETRQQPHLGFEALIAQFTSLLDDVRLTSTERTEIRRALSKYTFYGASAHIRSGRNAQARALLGASLLKCLSPRNTAVLAATFMPNGMLRKIAFR